MEQEEKKPTTLTGVDLSQTASLLLPWTHDPWGKLRPPLSEEALCMSAELASAAYGMAIEPWVEAGWRDVTIQVDGELTALPPNNPLSAEWRKYWVRARLKPVSALGQMLGALRLSSSNNTTGKAVVMLHPALDGRYVVAIGFMGTGSRFYDWFSNFRMTTQDGMHRGFLELARQFEANEEKISFPETAEELGLEKLTLRDILQNMRSPNSRFVLWVCGHSQGAAMMQVYAHLKMNETGISARNLIGYGFASPTVMAGRAVRDPSAYPLYNILNSDDLVPHCGAAVHLGMCLKYQATENLRKSCYNWKRDEKSVQARLAIRPVLWKMVDTPTCIIGGMALLMALGRVSGADFLKMLGLGGFLPLDRALEKADAEDFVRGLNGMMAAHELREMDHTVVLVFLTSLAQYAVESYEVEATDYILKPITAAALDLKLPRILNRCMVESEEEVVIQSGGTTTRLRPNELHYVEIYDHHIQFVTASGIMRSYGTLKAVEDALPDVFFRVNNQTIVNLRFVTHVGSNDTTVAGRTFPISRGRRKEFLSALHLAGMAE